MGRTQGFDTAVAVRAARDVFWDRGYDGASLPELERATGLRRSSIYHAFASKRGLFDAAVQDYLDVVVRPRLRVLTDEPVAPDAARRYCERLAATIAGLPRDSPRRGCLLLNSAAGLAVDDEALRAVIDSYRAELRAAMTTALRAQFPASPAAELDVRVQLLTAASTGALLLARVNTDEAVALLAAAVAQLDAWAGASAPRRSGAARDA